MAISKKIGKKTNSFVEKTARGCQIAPVTHVRPIFWQRQILHLGDDVSYLCLVAQVLPDLAGGEVPHLDEAVDRARYQVLTIWWKPGTLHMGFGSKLQQHTQCQWPPLVLRDFNTCWWSVEGKFVTHDDVMCKAPQPPHTFGQWVSRLTKFVLFQWWSDFPFQNTDILWLQFPLFRLSKLFNYLLTFLITVPLWDSKVNAVR